MGNQRKPNHIDRYIGQRIAEERKKAGMTLAALGAAMGGLSHQMVVKYEQGGAKDRGGAAAFAGGAL